MQTLPFIFLGIGIVFVSIALIILSLSKKITLGPIISLMMTGIIVMVGGMTLMLPTVQNKLATLATQKTATTSTSPTQKTVSGTETKSGSETATKSVTKTPVKVINTFDPKGSVRPKVTHLDELAPGVYLSDMYEDADGTKTITPYGSKGTIWAIFPNGARAYMDKGFGAVVQFPIKSKAKDGLLHYEEYCYQIGEFGNVYVSKQETAYRHLTDAVDEFQSLPNASGETQIFPQNSNTVMSYIDFIFKKELPITPPKITVKNTLITGRWSCVQQTLLNPVTLMTMDFDSNQDGTIQTSMIRGLPSLVHYELEPLGKNAYKMYIFPAVARADSMGGGVSVLDSNPFPRTFIIYMTSKDSFQIVFYDDNLQRQSLVMKRQ